jgi:hypothetical protein
LQAKALWERPVGGCTIPSALRKALDQSEDTYTLVGDAMVKCVMDGAAARDRFSIPQSQQGKTSESKKEISAEDVFQTIHLV